MGNKTYIKVDLIAKRPKERVCGTCDYWEGARELHAGMFHMLADSDGICRWLAEQKRGFLETLVLPGRECLGDCWRPTQKCD